MERERAQQQKAIASRDGAHAQEELNVYEASDFTQKTFDQMVNDWAFARNTGNNVTVINEIDQLDSKFQRQLRAHMDTYGDLGSFVMTTNYIESVDGGIRDRSDEIEMPHPGPDAHIKSKQKILRQEGVSMDKKDLKDLIETTDGSHRQIMRGLEDAVRTAKSMFEKAFLDHGQRLIRVAEAAIVMRVSATSVSCS